MSYKPHSFCEKSEFINDLICAHRYGAIIDEYSLPKQASELWPCSHRLDLISIPKNIKCENEEIREQLLRDNTLLDSTYTSCIHWNYDELITGKRAIAAGLVETAAHSIDSSADLLVMAEILQNLFNDSDIPILDFLYVSEIDHAVDCVTDMTLQDAMITLFYRRICSIERDDVSTQEEKDFEFQKLSQALDEYEKAIYNDE